MGKESPGARGRGKGGRRRRRHFRDVGRKVAFFAAADVLLSLLLPWIRTDRGGVNAFALRAARPILWACDAEWVALAVWVALGLSALAAVLALIDRARSLGPAPAIAALAAGVTNAAFAAYVFAAVVPLRQVGAIACGIGGLLFVAAGLILVRSPWKALPKDRDSALAHPGRLPWATLALVSANVAVHLAVGLRDDYATVIVREWGLVGGSLRWYAFFTSLFLHGDWLHLLSNMALLVAVGVALERRVGRAVFAGVYLAAGLAGAAASIWIDPRIYKALIGSSGAVAGPLGLCLLVAPRARVRVWFHALVTAGWVSVQAVWLAAAWFVWQAVGSFYLAVGETGAVAYWAHLGGGGVGLLVGAVLRRLGRVREEEGEPGKRSAFGLLPYALIGVSLCVTVLAVVLTFTSGSLLGTLAGFQRAWNTGELGAVEGFFRPETKQQLGASLRRVVRRRDPMAPGGKMGYRIILLHARFRERECKAVYASAPREADPYRTKQQGRVYVYFKRRGGRWRVRAMGLQDIRPPDGPGGRARPPDPQE